MPHGRNLPYPATSCRKSGKACSTNRGDRRDLRTWRRWHALCIGIGRFQQNFNAVRFDLDAYFGIQQHALKVHDRRNSIIASNLANADTPNYKARDLDFRAELARARGGGAASEVLTTHDAHLGSGPAFSEGALLYRVPMQPAQDGNTVETDREQAAYAENAVRYQAALQFLGGSIEAMINAIRGGSNR